MSKAKFKVGDKVRILDGSKIKNYTGGYPANMKQYTGRIVTIKCSTDFGGGRRGYNVNEVTYTWDERGLELVYAKPNWKVVIIPDGDKTIGRLYDGHNLVKEVATLKSPMDEYDMNEAIKVICERLTGKTEKKEEPPKLYNGRVICVDPDKNVDMYIKGKIYQIVNGKITTECGHCIPNMRNPFETFDDFANWSDSKWIEVVE